MVATQNILDTIFHQLLVSVSKKVLKTFVKRIKILLKNLETPIDIANGKRLQKRWNNACLLNFSYSLYCFSTNNKKSKNENLNNFHCTLSHNEYANNTLSILRAELSGTDMIKILDKYSVLSDLV